MKIKVVEDEAGSMCGHFGQNDPGIADFEKYQGIPSLKSDLKQVPHCSYTGGDFKDGSQGSHQGSGQLQREENKADSIPQSQGRCTCYSSLGSERTESFSKKLNILIGSQSMWLASELSCPLSSMGSF